jgi:hypothetical protein
MTPISEPLRPDLLSQPPLLTVESSTLMALSIDTRFGRACLLENISGVYRLAAWITVARQGERHLGEQVANVCRQLGSRLGRRLWDERNQFPLLTSVDPTRHPPLAQFALTVNPRAPLRIWIAGLTPIFSIDAGRLATIGCAAQVVGQSYLTVDASAERLSQTLLHERPDVVLVVGGYDTKSLATHRPLHSLSRLVAGAVQRIPRRTRPAIFYAGNHWATPEVEMILQETGAFVATVPNVMPTAALVRQNALARALDDHYRYLCQRMDGFSLLERWHSSPVAMSTIEGNFVRLVQTWMALHNQAELYGLYCGERWLHVWASEAQEEVALVYSDPDPIHGMLPGWPAPALVSGTWPNGVALPPSVRWLDRSGLAPVVAALAPVAPTSTYQVLSQDLLLPVT